MLRPREEKSIDAPVIRMDAKFDDLTARMTACFDAIRADIASLRREQMGTRVWMLVTAFTLTSGALAIIAHGLELI